MSQNIIFISRNHFDDATVSATPSPVATLPVDNLQNVNRSAIMRTSSTAVQDVFFSLDDVRIFSGLAITRHNIPVTATIRFRLWDAANQTGNLVYDSGEIQATEVLNWGDFVWGGSNWGETVFSEWASYFTQIFFDAVLAMSGQITITNTSPMVYDIGRVYAGQTIQTEYNCDWGLNFSWNENTTQTQTDGGTIRSDINGEPYRTLSFSYSHLSQADRSLLSEFRRDTGLRKDFFISTFPERTGQIKTDYAMACKFIDSSDFSYNNVFEFSHGVTIRET